MVRDHSNQKMGIGMLVPEVERDIEAVEYLKMLRLHAIIGKPVILCIRHIFVVFLRLIIRSRLSNLMIDAELLKKYSLGLET